VNISKKAVSCVGKYSWKVQEVLINFEAFIQSKASWTEGAEWTSKFPADAGSVCGKAPMTACMPQGKTEVHHVFICENVCTLPDDNHTNVKYKVPIKSRMEDIMVVTWITDKLYIQQWLLHSGEKNTRSVLQSNTHNSA
jgi:hypothetical protein